MVSCVGCYLCCLPSSITAGGSLGYVPESPLESPGITMTTRHFLSVSEDGGGEGEGEGKGEGEGEGEGMVEKKYRRWKQNCDQ